MSEKIHFNDAAARCNSYWIFKKKPLIFNIIKKIFFIRVYLSQADDICREQDLKWSGEEQFCSFFNVFESKERDIILQLMKPFYSITCFERGNGMWLLQAQMLGLDHPDSNPACISYLLCDLRQVTYSLCASFSLSVK